MNSIEKISKLFDALEIMNSMSEKQITENPNLVQDIKGIFDSRKLWGIVDDINHERYFEKQAAYNTTSTGGNLRPDSKEFLSLYAKYQSAAHNVLADAARAKNKVAYTDPISMKGAQAFNAKYSNPMNKRAIKTLPEARQFAEAFNSVFSNHALQIGTPQDPTLITSYIDYSPYIWNYQYYLSIPTLSQTVDMPIDMATRHAPKIESTNKEFSEAIETYFRRTMFNEQKVRKMLLYSIMSPRGSLIVPIEENGKIRFNTFNDTQFTYATSYQYSKIDFRDNATGVSQLFCLGTMLQNEVTAHFNCPGFEPIYAIGKNKLYQLKGAAEAVNIYLYTIKVLCIRAQIMIETSDMSGQNDTLLAKLKQQSDMINSRLSLNTAVKRPQGTTLEILNNNFNEGFAKISPLINSFQGALMGVHGEFIYGSDNASFQANNFNMRVSHQNIHSEYHVQQCTPIYTYAINTLCTKDVRFKKFENMIGEYELKYQALYEETDGEKADVDAKKIANLVAMRDYPELESAFKKEGLLPDEVSLAAMAPREPENPPT